jgi:hypothetical protein
MNDLLKIFDPDNYPDIPPKRGFTYVYQPPGVIRVRGNVQGDTFMLDSSEDHWEFWYGGTKLNIDWNHIDLADVDDSFIALWRHHLIEEIQVKSPSTVYGKFITFRNIAHDISPDISLTSMLAVFSRLHTEGRRECFHVLRVFYNWGITRGIEVFDRRTQNIINNLLHQKIIPMHPFFCNKTM